MATPGESPDPTSGVGPDDVRQGRLLHRQERPNGGLIITTKYRRDGNYARAARRAAARRGEISPQSGKYQPAAYARMKDPLIEALAQRAARGEPLFPPKKGR
jgi:hypothetical protein